MSRIFILNLTVFTLVACGGSTSSSPEPPILVPPVEPVDSVPAPIFPPNLNATTCTGLDFLDLLSVESSDTTQMGFEADKAIDDNLTSISRWESSVSGAQLTIELGYRHLVKEIGTAWYEGDQRISTFDIALSEDGNTYTTILTNETTSGITESFERFDIPDTVARFVRVISYGDNINSTTSFTEAAVFGCPLDVDVANTECKYCAIQSRP